MKKEYFSVEKDGFYGVYFQNENPCNRAVILMLGDDANDRMAISGAKWMLQKGCNVMTMSPNPKDYGHHSYPLERFEKVIAYLKAQGNQKIGVAGASTTGMLALVAASYFSDITLTLAFCPSDFVMEGFYQDGLDGCHERPEDNESKVVFVGAEDDVLWNTCKYIRRMVERLERLPHECEYEAYTYEHGTHFAFPQSMLTMMLPVISGLLVWVAFRAGRKYPKECKATRSDVDKKLVKVLAEW